MTTEFSGEISKTHLIKARTFQGPAIVEHDELEQLDSLSLNGREVPWNASWASTRRTEHRNSNTAGSTEYTRAEIYISSLR